MKAFTTFLVLVMVFSASAVFACGGPCDKDKDKEAFTVDVDYLCGGGCDKGEKPAPAPKPDKDPESVCGSSCGGDKDKKPAPEPEAMCGSSCGGGKDKEETKA